MDEYYIPPDAAGYLLIFIKWCGFDNFIQFMLALILIPLLMFWIWRKK